MLTIFLIVLSAFSIRLMNFQLVNGKANRTQAEKTVQTTDTVTAARGEILDRYGRPLATNRVGYTVNFQYAYLKSDQQQKIKVILKVTNILKQQNETWNDTLPISTTRPYVYTTTDAGTLNKFWAQYQQDGMKTKITSNCSAPDAMNWLVGYYKVPSSLNDDDKRTVVGVLYDMDLKGFSSDKAYECASDISMTTVVMLEERSLELPGVEIKQEPIRIYTDGTLAPHIIGTVGPIYAEEKDKYKKLGYSLSDQIGEFGIESGMEQYLHGKDGQEAIEVNRDGKVISPQKMITEATPGDTVVLTIDSALQKALQAALPATIQKIVAASYGNSEKGANAISGACVVLNVKTSEVLAMANYPSFDLNSYQKNYAALLKQTGNPLYDRCLKGTYRPGSTFKPCVATSALYYHAITPSTYFYCPGSWTFEGHQFNCDAAHGSENVIGGIKDSCNVFFYHTGWATGITNLDKTAKALGLGVKTGIELSGEATGVMSSPAEKAARGGGSWYDGDTLQTSIGQLDDKFTLLQLANYVSTIINGGTRHQVHLVRKILTYDGSKTIVDNTVPKVESQLSIPGSVTSVVLQGMQQVVEEGTASNVFGGYKMQVGGKTGTAQIPGGYNGLFVGYAPATDPQIAVAVVVEHGYHGNQSAQAALAAFNQYFYTTNQVSGPIKDGSLIQ